MRDELTKFPASGSTAASAGPSDALASARRSLKTGLRTRFYTTAEAAPCGDGFAVMLDASPALTPAKAKLIVPHRAAADALAAEWQAQMDVIDPATMPLTRLVNTAIDGVARNMAAVAEEIAAYASSDLVCYRAGDPARLIATQAEAWDPILAFIEADLNARFLCAEGIIHVAQPAQSMAAVRAKIARLTAVGTAAPIALACLHVMVSLTGSALIALARVGDALSLDEAWSAAHVDEDFQMQLWGADSEAMARRARRFAEMAAADRLWRLIRP